MTMTPGGAQSVRQWLRRPLTNAVRPLDAELCFRVDYLDNLCRQYGIDCRPIAVARGIDSGFEPGFIVDGVRHRLPFATLALVHTTWLAVRQAVESQLERIANAPL